MSLEDGKKKKKPEAEENVPRNHVFHLKSLDARALWRETLWMDHDVLMVAFSIACLFRRESNHTIPPSSSVSVY